jgi:hypothetical protein
MKILNIKSKIFKLNKVLNIAFLHILDAIFEKG